MNPEMIADSIVGIYIDQSTEDTPEQRGEQALDQMEGLTADTLKMVVLDLAARLAEWA